MLEVSLNVTKCADDELQVQPRARDEGCSMKIYRAPQSADAWPRGSSPV